MVIFVILVQFSEFVLLEHAEFNVNKIWMYIYAVFLLMSCWCCCWCCLFGLVYSKSELESSTYWNMDTASCGCLALSSLLKSKNESKSYTSSSSLIDQFVVTRPWILLLSGVWSSLLLFILHVYIHAFAFAFLGQDGKRFRVESDVPFVILHNAWLVTK